MFAPVLAVIWGRVLDLIKELGSVFGVEWWQPMNELIYNGPQTPPINRLPMPLLLDNLRSKILRRPTHRKSLILGNNIILGQSKIRQLNVSFFVNEYIFRFEVSVDDILGV